MFDNILYSPKVILPRYEYVMKTNILYGTLFTHITVTKFV